MNRKTRKSLRTADPFSVLLAQWRTRDIELWSEDVSKYLALGERLLKLGEPLIAYDVLQEGLHYSANDYRLNQLMALTLARTGAPERAESILCSLADKGCLDEETLGLKARLHKDAWQRASDCTEADRQLGLACSDYLKAYSLTGGYWTGINAATLSLVKGDLETARSLAQQVRQLCLRELEDSGPKLDRYWPLATLGESALVLGEWSEAEDWYFQAAEAGKGRFGDLASTRRNVRFLLQHLGIDGTRFEGCLCVPSVVVFSGHMVDRPDRDCPRFPPHLEKSISAEIRRRINALDAGIGFSSAACGGDILFLEAMLERSNEAHIILPFGSDLFKQESVEILDGSNWGGRFENVLKRAAEVVVVSEHRFLEAGISFEYANRVLLGLASLKAAQLETNLTFLTLWDGQLGDGPGGTASMVGNAKRLGCPVDWLDIRQIARRPASARKVEKAVTVQVPLQPPAPPAALESTTTIKAILFADLVDFSKMNEDEIPVFVKEFLGQVGTLTRTSAHAPEIKKTWGDGLYFVFDKVRDAGLFALDLRDLVRETDWSAYGLLREIRLRIGLHVGPVFSFIDPVTEQGTYFGTHVSRTARIEPVTPPGCVYASQAFAAIAAGQPGIGFKCEYVGQTPLAKDFGAFPTYHVRRMERKEAHRRCR